MINVSWRLLLLKFEYEASVIIPPWAAFLVSTYEIYLQKALAANARNQIWIDAWKLSWSWNLSYIWMNKNKEACSILMSFHKYIVV